MRQILKTSICFSYGLFVLFWFISPDYAFSMEKVRVGVYDNPPKVFMTPDGLTTGLYPDILDDIGKKQGWSIQYIPGTWQECLDRLEAKEIDILVDIAKTPEREKRYEFSSEPVLTNWGAVYAPKHLPFSSFQDMRNKSVAVVKGSVHTEGPHGFKDLMRLFDIPCRLIEVDSYRQALMLLDANQVDACVINRLFGNLFAADYDVVATPIVFSPRVLMFAGQKGNPGTRRLLDQIDTNLKLFKEDLDSAYHKAMAYYLSGGRQKWKQMQQKHLQELDLNEQEIEWLKKNPVVKIGIDPTFEPYEFISEDGDFEGMAVDYMALLSRRTGLKFKFVKYSSWLETIEAAKNREVDILSCVASTDERKDFLLFTDPYIKFSRVIITEIGSRVRQHTGLEGLKGLKVGVQENSSHHSFLKENSDIRPELYETFPEAILALSNGKIDAVVGNLATATHVMTNYSLTNLKFADYVVPGPQSLSVGVRKDWPELVSILNRTLKTVTYRERNRILSKWFPLPKEAYSNVGLTHEEREWLLLHPKIKVAWDREWAPIEFADSEGNPLGIAIDHLSALEKMLGIRFDMGQDIGWEESSKLVEQRKIDMFSCVAITPKRLKHLDFTDTYLEIPVVIFGRSDAAYVRDLSELHDKKVAVIAGYATDEWVTRDYPEFNLTKPASIKKALSLLEKKEIDAFIGNVLPGNYYLSQLKHHDIKIIGEAPYKHKLRMAVRNDWPLLTSTLQKALDALPDAEKNHFYRKWSSIKYEKGFDYTLFKKIMIIVAAVIVIIIFWNRYMAAEIARRKKIEQQLSRSESELRIRNAELKETEELKDNLVHMIVHDMRSPLTAVSMSLSLLNSRLKDLELEEDALNKFNVARNGTDILNRMLQSVLDVFSLESNELPLNKEELDIKETVSNAAQEMQAQAQMLGLTLAVSGESSIGQFDPEIIRRILTNLIENALKATPEKGIVEVVTKDDSMNMIVEVCDSGQGIPQEHQQRIFDKFASIKTDAKEKISSYGLGLAFCKLAVNAHKGRIEVESEEGKGSTFRIVIPKS